MAQATQIGARRTSVDDIYAYLYEEIAALRLRPGDKISEADIATKFGVSRQPVRDAFNRLATLDLLLIRPQRATEVKRFSMREIVKSRFVRLSVEKEVLQRAAAQCDADDAAQLDAALEEQERSVRDRDVDRFNALDYEFHKLICQIARSEFAFDVILSEKSKVDRLCTLSLSKGDRMPELVEDHRAIATAIRTHDAACAMKAGVHHLSRLDETIDQIWETNADYFTPEDT
ncbi:GntR family transcriptional regulator [Tateyamaria omphalii]|uniref:GntR family transcriptional regulator n=1 Tax=Tateyamaria omphalii TaxID=299262 RepID=A0A1P8MVD6_9RHOB|nr:GntR family transcriptional regulator [Tateyamaria omphalii]APX12014.1 GntR family transcriptional regulator [Tateyamaria omphalii]